MLHSTIERARYVHDSISTEMRRSAAPRVWSGVGTVWHQPAGEDALGRMRDYDADLTSATGPKEFTHIGVIVAALLRNNAFMGVPVRNHLEFGELRELLRIGHLPIGVPQSAGPLAPDWEHLRELGYGIGGTETATSEQIEAEQNAFVSARHFITHRASPQTLCFTARFVLPDPLAPTKTAYFLDQLWVARDEHLPDRVRLLGLAVGADLSGSSEQVRRDKLFARSGVEVFHASMSWARVDPARVAIDFLRRAGLAVRPDFDLRTPGSTIADYKCRECLGPMIRSATGEGIAFLRGEIAVHEECIDSAIARL